MASSNHLVRCWSSEDNRAIGVQNPSSYTRWMGAFQWIVRTSWATTISGSRDQGNLSQKHICQMTCPNQNSCRRRGLCSSIYDRRQANAISDRPIRCLWGSHDLELGWNGARHNPAWEWDLWHPLEWTEALQEGILHPHDRVWSVMGDNCHSGTPVNHWTACNPFRISHGGYCEAYIRVNWQNVIRWQFH